MITNQKWYLNTIIIKEEDGVVKGKNSACLLALILENNYTN